GYQHSLKQGQIRTLTDMSAYNVIAMLSFNDIEETTTILQKLKEYPRLLSVFARYQIYYYGGVEGVIETMKKYLSDQKIMMIPQSATALLWLFQSRSLSE
ncbi:MAG: hypothetical protein NTW48_09840, partial [Chloroflexi bacterium]|nr:hypothetical protein [Chloroflexota bacterium]